MRWWPIWVAMMLLVGCESPAERAPCSGDDCNSGQCDPQTGPCDCPAGYAGPRCARCAPDHIDLGDGCRPDPCAAVNCGAGVCNPATGACDPSPDWVCAPEDCNGGTCEANACVCPAGLAGPRCARCAPDHIDLGDGCQPDPCVEMDCGADGVCNPATGRCDCAAGFVATEAGCAPTPCRPGDCNGHGICDAQTGGCTCAAGWAGETCAVCADGFVSQGELCVPAPCSADRCGPNGVCDPETGGCRCAARFTGPLCDACIDGYAGVDCRACATGFAAFGDHCVVDRCDPDPCNGNGDCDPVTGQCACPEGYGLPDCHACAFGYVVRDGACVDDPCEPNPCGAQAACQADGRCVAVELEPWNDIGGACQANPCTPWERCVEGECRPRVVEASTLFESLQGFAGDTTGGLGGQLYVVDRTDDVDEPGTLRHGVQSLEGPTWIVFDPAVFPVDRKVAIYLERALTLRSNLTIDGRGSQVSIRSRNDYDRVRWAAQLEHTKTIDGERVQFPEIPCDANPSPTGSCTCIPNAGNTVLNLFQLQSVENVIVTHLDFAQIYVGELPPLGGYLDKQCFGDPIWAYNLSDETHLRHFDRIWINQSDFRNCADECVAATNPSTNRRAHVTVSNNRFAYTNKAVIIGTHLDDSEFQIAASLYGNRFVQVRQRAPRVQHSYAHIFNNLYEAWLSYGVMVFDDSRVMIEQNLFRAGERDRQPWRRHKDEDTTARVWARDNVLEGVNVEPFRDRGFPACAEDDGPWYYQCSQGWVDIAGMPYQAAIDHLRARAGWQPAVNDVRD